MYDKLCSSHSVPCKYDQPHVNRFYMAYLQNTLLKRSTTFNMAETKFLHVDQIYMVIYSGIFPPCTQVYMVTSQSIHVKPEWCM